ncbi:MAG: phospholipid-binding protein, partial [Pseudomonadota bacterium]|nr:phospholipid-binding protein [Pseudomonadota bacterium]
RGIVYLMGLLRPEEAEAVVGTVRRVGGVQKVVSLFEYI